MPSSLSSTAWRWLCAALLTLVLFANSSLAGSTRYVWSHLAGSTGGPGSIDGTGSAAGFNSPQGVTVDGSGNVYVADLGNHTIRKISPAGVTTTLAGLAGVSGSTDGTGAAARFYFPSGVAVDGSGNIYVADSYNHTIRRISPAGETTTIAGLAGASGSTDGTGAAARFYFPSGVAVDGTGNIYVADLGNHTIRKITPEGVTTTLAGLAAARGSADGTGAAARFNYPNGVTVDGSGSVYVADANNYTIRKISPSGETTTLAGLAGTSGSADGTGAAARFSSPRDVTVDGSGNVYVADWGNNTIRKISPAGETTTLAGLAGTSGSRDGTGAAARFYYPRGVKVDGSGNVYVADANNHTIRKITPEGVTTTLAGLAAARDSTDGTGAAARFDSPQGVTVDGAGNVYVADYANHTIRKISPAGVTTTLAGLAGVSGATDGTGAAARFYFPSGVAVDGAGNVYVADYINHTIRKISPSGETMTLAGLARASGSTDGTGAAARFNYPNGVTVDGSGNVYVADSSNHTIRKISPAGETTTLAGLAGTSGSTDGTGAAARFSYPNGVTVDASGNVYVADYFNHTIRKISPSGETTTLAGLAGTSGSRDGTGAAARFYDPRDVTVDGSGNVYVVDPSNTIRKISPSGVTTTLAGLAGFIGSTDGIGAAARFNNPYGVAVDHLGNLYVADEGNNAIRKGTLRGTRADFLGSAGTDLVWQNTTTGQRGLWIMDGVSFMSWVDLGTVPIAWRIAGTADFNLDGSPDIVWENTSTGERGAWLMNNTAFSSWLSLGTVPTAWRIAQVGASDAGDKTYLLWENTTTGERYIWTYTGTTFTSSTFLGVVPTDWKMVGFGDLNADTYNDLVWENTTTGERGVWFLNSSLSYTGWQSLGIIPTEWHIAGLADYNADDKLDLLWENTSTGQRLVWHLDGTSYSSTGLIGSAPAEWRVTN